MTTIINPTTNVNSARSSTRYTQGGTSDVFNNRVGWWERRNLPKHETDIFFDIDRSTEFRPDLIAHRVYRNSKYAWVVLQFNNIVDIREELIEGKTITLPSSERLQSVVLSQSNGGRRVQ